MEIHESAYLTLCVGNWHDLHARRHRRGIRPDAHGAGRPRGGGLPGEGRDGSSLSSATKPAQRGLRKALGDNLYLRLLEQLREEDYHMLAGGLMHEGMHAGLDDTLVARLQAEFASRQERRPVGRDEVLHGRDRLPRGVQPLGRGRHRRTIGVRSSARSAISRVCARSRASNAGPDLARFERTRARIWAFAALLRLRMREIWQSARRMQDLAEGFQEDYVEGRSAGRYRGAVRRSRSRHGRLRRRSRRGHPGDASSPSGPSKRSSIRGANGLPAADPSLLRSRTPPAVIKQLKGIPWPEPAPAAAGAAALMKRAAEALEKERTSS